MNWTGPLIESREPIRAALRALLNCPEVFRPFVVIEAVEHPQFVQFAGSTERGLIFDVPALDITLMPVISADDGVEIAFNTLRKMKLDDRARVRVRFESTHGRKIGRA